MEDSQILAWSYRYLLSTYPGHRNFSELWLTIVQAVDSGYLRELREVWLQSAKQFKSWFLTSIDLSNYIVLPPEVTYCVWLRLSKDDIYLHIITAYLISALWRRYIRNNINENTVQITVQNVLRQTQHWTCLKRSSFLRDTELQIHGY